MSNKNEVSNDDFEWIDMRRRMNELESTETFTGKFLRKTKENPLVPFGSALTLFALSYGLWCFKSGRSKKSQQMMRLRVFAQGFTVVALVLGIGFTALNKTKESAIEIKNIKPS